MRRGAELIPETDGEILNETDTRHETCEVLSGSERREWGLAWRPDAGTFPQIHTNVTCCVR